MKSLGILLCFCMPAFAFGQKMHVRVVDRSGHIDKLTRIVPGVALGNGSANANCTTINCSANGSSSSIYVPAHTQDFYAQRVDLRLLLPDGRRVDVTCNDRPVGRWKGSHRCAFPLGDEAEADFSGDKVKLTWGLGLDGRKKESETYVVGRVYPASTTQPN